MRKLTLIRHGITDWNSSGRFQGHSDVPLSSEGEAQAEALRGYLAQIQQVDLVYSSPLKRACQTAKLCFPETRIHCDPRLMELNFGVFEGSTLDENQRHADWPEWYRDPFKRAAPDGESYEQLRERAVAWLYDLPERPHIAAVTHSGTIQMLVSHVLGVERPRWRKRIFLRHTSVTRFLFRGDEIVIERVNDTRHLDTNGLDPFND